MRVLGMGGSAGAGFASGYGEAIDEAVAENKGGFWDKIGFGAPPWEWITAVGAGFSEIPDAVGQGKRFEEVLQERWDRDSWFYKHAKPIGLTMDVLLDPITYLSFGATTPARIASRKLWHHEWQEAYREADEAIALGKSVPGTNVQYRALGRQQAALMFGLERRVPFTPGDALARLRGSSLNTREAMMAGEHGRLAQMRASLIPGVRAPGGGGIRFMGMELPGTKNMMDYMARSLNDKIRRSKGTVKLGDILQFNGGDLLPRGVVEELMSDVITTAAKVNFRDFIEVGIKSDMERFQGDLRGLFTEARDAADEARKLRSGRYTTKEEREFGFEALKGFGTRPIVGVSKEANVARAVNSRVIAKIQDLGERAEEHGFTQADVNRWWRRAMDNPSNQNDPTLALYEFHWRASTEFTRKRFQEHLLDDPMFAMKINKKPGEEYSAFASDLNKHFAPEGFEVRTYGPDQYFVRREVVDAIDKFRNPAVMEKELAKFFKYAGKVQQLWKIPATVMNPSFHVMNFVGAVWNNLLAGVWNPLDYTRAAGVMYRTAIHHADLAGRRTALTGFRKPIEGGTERNRAAAEFFGQAENRGGLGLSNFVFGDIVGEVAPQLELRGGKLTAFERAYRRAPGESKKRYGFKQARRAGGTAALATGVGGPLAALAFAPEIAAVGRQVGGTIEDMVRLAPFIKASRDPYLRGFLDEFGPNVVNGMTHPGLSHAEQSVLYDIGASISKGFQFDYQDLHPVERVLKQVFPFWVYYKNNFLLQTEQLARQPRNVLTAQKVFNYVSEQAGELGDVENVLPEYFDNLGAFQIPVPGWAREKMGLPQDQPLFLNPKLPFMSAFSMFPPFWEFLRDTNENVYDKIARVFITPVAGAVGPFAPLPIPGAKLMFEAWANRSLGLGRPIDFQRASSNDVRNSYVPAPGWMKYLPKVLQNYLGAFPSPTRNGELTMTATAQYVLNSMASPFVSNMGKSIPISASNQGKAMGDLVSWMTGIRLMPVDTLRLTRAWAYSMENALEGRRAELQEQGVDLPPEEMDLLFNLRAQLKAIEAAYDQQIGEAYGG
jgi:hypothetical protein